MEELQFHELANEHELLSGDDLENLSEDIQANGLHHAIVLYEGKILEGRNRYNACKLKGIAPRYEEYTGDDPVGYVLSLNDFRRHDRIASPRLARISLVKKLRSLGKTTREIACQAGVHQTQVMRDLIAAEEAARAKANQNGEHTTVFNSGSAAKPKKAKKKSTPTIAKKKKPKKPKKKTVKVLIQEGKLAVGQLADELGEPVPPGLAPVFAERPVFTTNLNLLTQIQASLLAVSKKPAGIFYRHDETVKDLGHVLRSLKLSAPHAVCPACKGNAKERKANCPCANRGFFSKSTYDLIPQEFRA